MSGREAVSCGQFWVAHSELSSKFDHDTALLHRGIVFHLSVKHDRAGAVAHGINDTLCLSNIFRAWAEHALGNVDLNWVEAPGSDAPE